MKEVLKKYAENILEALGVQGLTVCIFDCETDSVPAFLCPQEESFLVCYTYEATLPDPAWLKRLQKFIGKELLMSAHGQETYVYWFENKSGKPIAPCSTAKKTNHPGMLNKNDNEFVTHAILPEYIDAFIFDSLKAVHSPNYMTFSHNLTHTKNNILIYLGTYFPRSYAESFCIFKNMLHNTAILTDLQNKQELEILSIGCGTGGDLLGLLSLLAEKLPHIKRVSILAADGNTEALSILEDICKNLHKYWPFQLFLDTRNQTFEEKINATFLSNAKNKFDFILSFKMIGELLRRSAACENFYSDFCTEFLPHLANTGLCVLLDVTTKTKDGSYLPIVLNSQINNAMKSLGLYKTLLPLPCNLHENACSVNNCFSQKIFTIEHSRHRKDKSKVCYRVIAHREFCNNIKTVSRNTKYNIGSVQRTAGDNSCDVKICPHTHEHKKEHDGYNLMG